MTKEEETEKGSGDNTLEELECACCSGCCGVPIQDQVDPTEDKEPLDGG